MIFKSGLEKKASSRREMNPRPLNHGASTLPLRCKWCPLRKTLILCSPRKNFRHHRRSSAWAERNQVSFPAKFSTEGIRLGSETQEEVCPSRGIWGNYKQGVLDGRGGAELGDLEKTALDGDFVDGRLEGRVSWLRSISWTVLELENIFFCFVKWSPLSCLKWTDGSLHESMVASGNW